jgi:hypothetical protein
MSSTTFFSKMATTYLILTINYFSHNFFMNFGSLNNFLSSKFTKLQQLVRQVLADQQQVISRYLHFSGGSKNSFKNVQKIYSNTLAIIIIDFIRKNSKFIFKYSNKKILNNGLEMSCCCTVELFFYL